MNKESYNKAWLKQISDLNIIKSGSDEDTHMFLWNLFLKHYILMILLCLSLSDWC